MSLVEAVHFPAHASVQLCKDGFCSRTNTPTPLNAVALGAATVKNLAG